MAGKTRIESANVRAAAINRRRFTPLTVKGITRGNLLLITTDKFTKLDVDPRYQRGETSMVGEIVSAIQAGGEVLDPVTLCKRPWDKNKDTLWVVDGYQRVCAFQQLGIQFQAMVHQSESLEAEKQFFLALNARKAVGTDVIVRSWTGPCSGMIVGASERPSHSLYERINFHQTSNRSRLGAGVVARGMLVAATGAVPVGHIQKLLSRLDVAIGVPLKKIYAERFLQLIGELCPKGTLPLMVTVSLAFASNERWGAGASYPDKKTIEKLRKINWNQEVPEMTVKYRPIILALIDKAWKKETKE